MPDLSTTYMGIEIRNPLVVGACSLSRNVDTIKQIEAAGAGALVIKSLFEEQVQLERQEFEQGLEQYDEVYAEAMSLFPNLDHGGPKEHLYWVEKARKAVKMPLIASLNAVTREVWVDYARQLADTGVDGLELNFYSLSLDPEFSSGDLEMRELEIFSRVREAVKIPIAVKLHPHYTNLMHYVTSLDRLGANAVVLFNRMFSADLNIESLDETAPLVLSKSTDSLHTLRWTGLLYGRLEADIVANTGILTGRDAVKMILAGAGSVQVVSTLYKNKLTQIGAMLEQISDWMGSKGYKTLDDFRGAASKQNAKDPWAYERGQYIKALLGFE